MQDQNRRRPTHRSGGLRSLLALGLAGAIAASCGEAQSREAGEDGSMEDVAADYADDQSPDDRPGTVETDFDDDQPADALVVPAGTELRLTLDDELATRSSQVGDPFEATVSDDVWIGGATAIPAGARLHGSVTAVQKAEGDQPGILKLEVETISLMGEQWPIDAVVSDVTPETRSESSTAENVAKVGVTTAVGAILGRAVGGSTESTVVGAAVGAAAGTAIVLSTNGEYSVLPEGSEMRVRLASPLTIPTASR